MGPVLRKTEEKMMTDGMGSDPESFAADLHRVSSRVQDILNQQDIAALNPLADVIAELHADLDELRAAHLAVTVQNDELQRAAVKLARERRRYQQLFDSAPDVYLVTNHAGVIIDANQAACTIFRETQSGLVGKTLSSFIPPGLRSAFKTRLREFMTEEADMIGEITIRPRKAIDLISFSFHAAADGDSNPAYSEIRWLWRSFNNSAIGNPTKSAPILPNHNLQLQPFLASCQTLLQTEETGKVLTTLAQLLADTLGDYTFISMLDPTGKLLKPVAGGSRRPEFLAMISQFLQADAQSVEGHVGKKVLQSEQPLVVTVGAKGKSATSNGGSKADRAGGAMNMLMLPLRATGKPLGLVAVIRDPSHPPFSRDEVTVAESLSTHATLVYLVSQHLQEQAESAWMNAGRGSFLTDLLADLQAPLHAMSGYISLIQEQAAENELMDISTDSEVMAKALGQCNTTLEDLSEIVRIEQCLVKPTFERFTVQELIQDIASSVLDKSERSKIRVEIPEHLEKTVVNTDLVRFRLAIGRVLEAVCSRVGNCWLTCESRHESICFKVHCAGKIFGPAVFLQLFNKELPEATTARPYRGAGTSLVLAQRITKLLHGEFSIEVCDDGETVVNMTAPVY